MDKATRYGLYVPCICVNTRTPQILNKKSPSESTPVCRRNLLDLGMISSTKRWNSCNAFVYVSSARAIDDLEKARPTHAPVLTGYSKGIASGLNIRPSMPALHTT